MNTKKKLAFVIHSLTDGGAERVVTILSNHLSHKFNVIIITLVKANVFYKVNDSIPIFNVKENNTSKNLYGALLNNWQTVSGIKSIIRKEKVDILISFTTSVNVLCLISTINKKVPSIISERNNAMAVPPNFFWKNLRNLFYKHANFLVVQTQGNKNFYSSIMRDSKIEVIQNPLAKTYDLTPQKVITNKFNILTVGRLTKNKAHHIILHALHKIDNVNWNLTIIGDGPEMEPLKDLTIKLNLHEKVLFTGQISNVKEYYLQSDIFLFTSRSEGFPNALMEAYAFGVPCISTDCNYGPSDIIKNDHDGILIPVDDINNLEKAIRRLSTDKSLREKFSDNAKKNIARFNINLIASKWEELVEKSLSK